MPTSAIPLYSHLNQIYTPLSLPHQLERWQVLRQAFLTVYEHSNQSIVRAPGRVNIIGEHIDYSGFSVVPSAIERDVLIAVSTSRSESTSQTLVKLVNYDARYTSVEFTVDLNGNGEDITLSLEHHWSNYVKCGFKGMLRYLSENPNDKDAQVDISNVNLMVSGSVPEGSGLSSSSALTTASVIAAMVITRKREQVGRRMVTQIAIESERLVGVNSGGMDQAASVFASANHLLHIEFVPTLIAHPIPLPSTTTSFSFVIANSLVTSQKAVTAKHHYNLRVVETRMGARLLAKHLDLPLNIKDSRGNPLPTTYRAIVDEYSSRTPVLVGEVRNEVDRISEVLLRAVRELVPTDDEGMTLAEVCSALNESEEDVKRELIGREPVEPVNGRYKVWPRLRHILTEAARVYTFRDLISAEDSNGTLMTQLGELMTASQVSCRQDYECSCPEIDEIVEIAMRNGAVGSRLTGAGWGGATVSLIPEHLVASFILALREEYYAKRFPQLTESEIADACFATKPESGACVLSE